MKLEKAIEIKEAEQLFHPRVHDPDKFDANELSLEALKFLEKIPALPIRPGRDLLPGETEE